MDDSDDDIPIASLTAKIAPAPIIKSEPKPPPAAAPAAAAKPKPIDGAIPKKVKKEVSNAEKYPGLTADEIAYKEKLKEVSSSHSDHVITIMYSTVYHLKITNRCSLC